MIFSPGMPEGEKNLEVPLVIDGHNLSSPVVIRLTDLQKIGGATPGTPGTSGPGIPTTIQISKAD